VTMRRENVLKIKRSAGGVATIAASKSKAGMGEEASTVNEEGTGRIRKWKGGHGCCGEKI